MNQPKRILNKSRRKYSTSRLSSGSNGANEDGWYKTHPKAKAKKKNKKATSLVDSDCESLLSQSDDDNEVVALGSSKKLKKPSKFAKTKTSWNNNDSSSSDDVSVNQSSSSSESSDESIAGVVKKKKKDKKKKQKTANNTKPSNITNKQSKVQVAKPTSNVATKSKKTKIVAQTDMNKSSTAGVKTEAETKANKVSIPEDITSIDQLQWYRIKLIQTEQHTKERLQPCRVLSLGEAAKHNTTCNNSSKKTVVIQYITFPNIKNGIYKTIDNDNNSLIPFGYKSRDGISTTFNDDYLQRYINQQSTKASGLEAEKIYIKRLFMYAANMERKAREDRKRDYHAYHNDDSSSNSSSDENSDSSDEEVTAKRKVAAAESRKVAFEVDSEDSDSDDESNGMMDDLDVPYTQAITFDPDDFGIGGSDDEEERSNEPIRPGDVIEYYSPIFVAGDARGLRQATVLSTDPNDDMPLVLSNGEGLPTNTKVKRIKVNEGGDLLDHSGIFRPIYRFKLSKRGMATAADGVAHEAARFTKIMQKNMSKLKEKAEADGFAPMDMIMGGKWNVGTSKSKQSSNRKVSNRRRKDDDSSSEDGDSSSSSSEDEKPRSKKAPTSTSRPALNKENNGTKSSDKERQSEASLSSGSFLSEDDDDDSSIESVKAKGRKAKKSRDNHIDLSFMSDDDDNNERYTSAKKSAKAIVRSTSKSTGLTFNTESSFESPTQSYSKEMPISKPTSNSVSRRRLKLDNPAYQSNNEMKQSLSEKGSRRKKELPSSPSSSSSSSGSSISANSVKRKKSITSGRKRSASSDSVELISDTKRNIKPKATISKKRQSLSSDDESSSDDSSDDDIPTKPRCSKQLKRGQSLDSSMSSTNHNTKSKKTRDPPTQERTDLGWTKSKIGWTKKDDSVGSKSPGFSIMKANNKNGKKSPGLGIMRVK